MSEYLPIDGQGEVVVEHPVTKLGVTIPVSVELLRDFEGTRTYITKALDDSFDRYLHPWNYSDRPRWPEFVPLPRLAGWVQSMRERRQRAVDAWAVLAGRERIWTEEDDQW